MSDTSGLERSPSAKKWQETILANLAKSLQEKRLVLVVGAGVTLHATADHEGRILDSLTWKGLISDGLRYLVDEKYTTKDNPRLSKAQKLLDEDDEESLLDAADKLKRCLEEHRQLPTWLFSVFGNLRDRVQHPEIYHVLRDLHNLGATLVTTNYDDLLETMCGIGRISRSNKDDLIKFDSGDLDGVFHIHGTYHEPSSIILNTIDYYVVQQDDLARETMESFFKHKTILFIGTGAGLVDPNFGRLLSWAKERSRNVANRHVILLKDVDQPDSKLSFLLRATCGPEWSGMAPYLQRVLSAAASKGDSNQTNRRSPVNPAAVLELLRKTTVKEQVRAWLEAPNTFQQHYDACEKRHKDTGSWFTKSAQFQNWLDDSTPQFLWLYGPAGSGKSILASTIIQETLGHVRSSEGMALAYFYFSYADSSKQTGISLLKSLVLQLSCQTKSEALKELYLDHLAGSPPRFALERTFRALTESFNRIFIVLDAVDECPAGHSRITVLKSIDFLRDILLRVNLLITSRDEADIRSALKPLPDEAISIHNESALDDIRRFVRERLLDGSFSMWTQQHKEIEKALMNRSSGMFRWVDCQMSAIQSCLTVNMLRSALQGLPETLDETYDRMLAGIDVRYHTYAWKILTVLCLSARPVEICELIEALAVDIETETGRYDSDDKLSAASDLLRIVSGLISIQETASKQYLVPSSEIGRGFSDEDVARRASASDRRIVRLSHFSVQEYLSSERVAAKFPMFYIKPDVGHLWLSRLCLAYLLHVGETRDLLPQRPCSSRQWYYGSFDFFNYACFQWSTHAKHCSEQRQFIVFIDKISMTDSITAAFAALMCNTPGVFDLNGHHPHSSTQRIITTIQWMSYHGMTDLLRLKFASIDLEPVFGALHDHFQDSGPVTSDRPVHFEVGSRDSLGGEQMNVGPVDIAIAQSHWETGRMLLETGFLPLTPPRQAHRESISTLWQNEFDALKRAASTGHDGLISLLLQNRKHSLKLFNRYFDPATSDPFHPLLIAAADGDRFTVEMLVTQGIGIRGLQGFGRVTPLMRAAKKGNLETVKCLLKTLAVVFVLEGYERFSWIEYGQPEIRSALDHIVEFHNSWTDLTRIGIFLRANSARANSGRVSLNSDSTKARRSNLGEVLWEFKQIQRSDDRDMIPDPFHHFDSLISCNKAGTKHTQRFAPFKLSWFDDEMRWGTRLFAEFMWKVHLALVMTKEYRHGAETQRRTNVAAFPEFRQAVPSKSM